MKKYLIIPAMPTPNGPLHLGHIGGPYLRADILARHLRQYGHQVSVLSGTDNYENYTYRQAIKENLTPYAICNKYYPKIVSDMKAMNIQLDDFINIHDEKWHIQYQQWCSRLLRDAMSAKRVHRRNDHLALAMPEEYSLCAKGINPPFISAYRRFLSQTNHRNLLTSDCDWGIPSPTGKSLLSYAFIHAYYQMLAEYAKADQETTIIVTIGVDNAVPVLASVLGFSAISPSYQSVDYYLINYFYYANGKKLSTSTRHAIWVADIAKTNISVDILRLFLAGIDVTTSAGNFTYEAFLQFHDAIKHQIERLIRRPLQNSRKKHEKSTQFLNSINAALQPSTYKPHIASQAILDWLKLGESIAYTSAEYSAWLQALSIGCHAIMPELSARIEAMARKERVCTNMI